MKSIVRLMGMGLPIGFVPLATSLGLFDKSGKLTVSFDLLKVIIVTIVLSTFIEKLLGRSKTGNIF